MKFLLISLLIIPFWVKSQRVYLIGDAGEPKFPDKNFQLLSEKFDGASSEDVLIFLGDNLYPIGLPDKEDPLRGEMEKKLVAQLDVMKSFPGKKYMIPGNHDWAQGRKQGWKNIQNMNRFVSEYLSDGDVFVPYGGCPGPIEVQLSSSSTLILFDSQYLLHGWDKPDEDDFCENKGSLEALADLMLMIEQNKDKHIVLATHHPMYTYGPHHGNFPFTSHLTPLPILGSVQPFFRRFIGNIQDNTNPKYRAIMNQVVDAMNQSKHVIYASGHEHSLQLIDKQGHHFIVSGSGSKTTYVKQGKGSRFAKKEQGFAILELMESGEATIEFWGVDNGLLFQDQLYEKEIKADVQPSERPDFQDSTLTVVASSKYQAGKAGYRWLGKNYREVWSTPIEVDVFDLSKEKGGLKVLKKGGGMQTKSLRLEAEDGRQYVLRSIEKYPENAIPDPLRKTFAQDIVQDQISASHPYGAFIVPKLAEAAEIYHTNPKPVYIPDDPLLGQFQDTFSGTLALYEERPNKEFASEPFFGSGEDVDGTDEVIENLRKDNDNSVDQNFVVRNRLFDMWIGDWDRHDDQWRWVQFDKKGKGNMFRPIPRDRDQAFFINEGIIPKIASRKWALPKIEGFDEEVRWSPGISQNARFFDRTFMNEPDWEDWEKEIAFLQGRLTDEVVEAAVTHWPEGVKKLTGERVSRGLKARREDMPRYAKELYLYLSEEVEIVGSDKHEYFLIERLSEEETSVTVNKRKKDGEIKQVLYQRKFKASETKEIRLYGLDGEDVFEIKGTSNSKIKTRIIGGTDKDRIINGNGETKLKNLYVYDRLKSTKMEGNSKGILRLSKDPAVNTYDRKAFQYDVLMPLVTGAANPDDGLFLGGGFVYTRHGWRKQPYASKHTLLASTALATDSYNFTYDGSFTDVIGKWDFDPSIIVQQPFFVNNFFGLGNETPFLMDRFVLPEDDDPIDYYRVRMRRFETDINFSRNVGSQATFYTGPGYRSIEVERTENRFITDVGLSDEDFTQNNYFKYKVGIRVDTRKNKIMPTSGAKAFAEIEHFEAIEDFSESFTRFSAEWAFYVSTKLPSRLTIANRFGAAHNTNNFEFFNANILGGRSNLRGYRRTRFYGQTSFYHNLDLRLKLFSFRTYIFPGQFGISAFHDTGRVWLDGERSDDWHTGKGFGIWLSPLNTIVLNLNYAFGEDENLPAFYLGFFF